MSDNTDGLRRKIANAQDLQSVVQTMKALAASSLGQYEKSVAALADYYHTVQLGLHVCLSANGKAPSALAGPKQKKLPQVTAIVFGSDQGLVGQFNEVVADFALKTFASLPQKPVVWAVGERVQARLAEAGMPAQGLFAVPHSAAAISHLVGEMLVKTETGHNQDSVFALHLFYNRPTSGAAYEPVSHILLPLDEDWQKNLAKLSWPTNKLPEILGTSVHTLETLIREYLFVSLFKASAESLASENGSRLAAMQRADKNIDDLLGELNGKFYRLRQSTIDEELFDVISGFEALGSD